LEKPVLRHCHGIFFKEITLKNLTHSKSANQKLKNLDHWNTKNDMTVSSLQITVVTKIMKYSKYVVWFYIHGTGCYEWMLTGGHAD
jgi:hypothetical protein